MCNYGWVCLCADLSSWLGWGWGWGWRWGWGWHFGDGDGTLRMGMGMALCGAQLTGHGAPGEGVNPSQNHTLHLQSPLALTFSCPWRGEDVVGPSSSTLIFSLPGRAVSGQSSSRGSSDKAEHSGGTEDDVLTAVLPPGCSEHR